MRKITDNTLEKIKFLRSHGYSIPEISKDVKVSKTSVLRYAKSVDILPEFLSEWAGKRGGSRKIRLKKEKKAYEEAKEIIDNLTQKEKLLLLSSLYWAEGNKRDFSLSNTDPNLIYVFVRCLRDIFNLDDSKFHINVRLYEDLDIDKSLEFWSKVVKIPKGRFKGVNILKGKKVGKLEYGMCRIRITKGGDILKTIKGVNKVIYECLSL